MIIMSYRRPKRIAAARSHAHFWHPTGYAVRPWEGFLLTWSVARHPAHSAMLI